MKMSEDDELLNHQHFINDITSSEEESMSPPRNPYLGQQKYIPGVGDWLGCFQQRKKVVKSRRRRTVIVDSFFSTEESLYPLTPATPPQHRLNRALVGKCL